VKVLVVDDYPGAAEITCLLLQLLGHESASATTAAKALAVCDSFGPDVIVLDLNLPDQSGLDVARALRARGGKQPFIAAMTGRNAPEDRVESLAAGIDLHVLKPASADNLTKILDAAKRRFTGDDAEGRA
jgi:DNA-binding response OmpR family regulator